MKAAEEQKLESMDLLTVAEVSQILSKCNRTIYRWIDTGKLKALRVGGVGDYMIPRAELMKSLDYKPKAQE